MHLKKIFHQGELDQVTTCKDFLHVQNEGGRKVKRSRKFYNLDAVISVGYRVNSVNATRFRQWANRILKEYLTRGYALNEKRPHEQNQKLADLHRTVSLLEQTLAHQTMGENEARGAQGYRRLCLCADHAGSLRPRQPGDQRYVCGTYCSCSIMMKLWAW